MRVPNFFSHLKSRIWKNRASFFFTEYFLNDQHDMTHIFFHEDIGSFPTPKEQLIVNLKILYISLGMKRTYFPQGFFLRKVPVTPLPFWWLCWTASPLAGSGVRGWGSQDPVQGLRVTLKVRSSLMHLCLDYRFGVVASVFLPTHPCSWPLPPLDTLGLPCPPGMQASPHPSLLISCDFWVPHTCFSSDSRAAPKALALRTRPQW